MNRKIALITLIALVWSGLVFCGEIHDAAKNGDLDKVKALLKANPDVISSKDTNGWTPLFFAVTAGQKEMTGLLLANKAKVNIEANPGRPNVLMQMGQAVRPGSQRGYNIIQETKGETPLHLAAEYGHADVARLLLAHGADTNAKDNCGRTALHFAAAYGFKEVADALLASKAHVDAKDNFQATPLRYATIYGYKDVVELLLAHGADVNDKGNDGDTALHWAASNNHKDVAKLLLAHGAEIDAKDGNGYTPLLLLGAGLFAEGSNCQDLAEMLLAQGSDVNATNKYGWTPLHSARDKVVAGLLLAHGADVNARDSNGRTPLFQSVSSRNKDLVELLLANKADVNATDNNGETPLHMVAFEKLKASKGVSVEHKSRIREGIIELLKQHGGHE